MTDLLEPMTLMRGPQWKNRFMLAPLTNLQSHPDGRLSDDEFNWLTYRATGGFGLVMTCAAHVQRVGQGFPGQLGVFSDDHLVGLTRLAARIKAEGAVSSLQLHHAGIRSPKELIGEQARGPSDDAETGARALTPGEVEALIEDFIAAAVRSEKAGFDGVELHGAHGYILCAFLSPETNRRDDRYGGSPEGDRARIVFEIIAGVRERTRPDFQLVSSMPLSGALRPALRRTARAGPPDAGFRRSRLSRHVAVGLLQGADRGRVRATIADRLVHRPATRRNPPRRGRQADPAPRPCERLVDHGADFAILGRAAVLHHDFPMKVAADPDFRAISLPVTRAYLRNERLGPAMVEYMNGWKGFVAEEETAEASA